MEKEEVVEFGLATITAVSLLNPLSNPIDFEISHTMLKKESQPTILKKESQPTIEENRVEIKGENNMIKKDMGLNLEFGKIENELAMSINGLAFKNAGGGYVTYDLQTNSLTDVSSLILNIDMLYSMPAAIKDIKAGDIIKHNKQYVIVSSIEENGDLNCVQPFAGEKIIVLPKKNIFGFNYITKVVNLMEQFMPQNVASEENPFGNMTQFILMSSLFDKSEDDGMKKMMMMSMLAKGDNSISPMMMFM